MTSKSGLGVVIKVTKNYTIRKPGTISYSHFHSNYGHILYHFGDKARYWSKIDIFSYPTCINAHVRGSPSDHLVQKSRILWLPAGEEILRICLVISTQLDRQRQTLDDGIDRVYADIARQTLSMQFTRCCCVNVRIA